MWSRFVGTGRNRQTGIAVTDLRPAGKVEVGGEVYDAVSLLGDYIEKGNRVMIKKYQAGQVMS